MPTELHPGTKQVCLLHSQLRGAPHNLFSGASEQQTIQVFYTH